MTKKLLSTLMAALLLLAGTTTAFAANPKITEQTDELAYTADIGERGPGYELWIPLDKACFDDGALEDDITTDDVKASKIDVRIITQTGKDAIGSIAVKGDKNKLANIVVTLADPFKGTKPLDFSVTFCLTIDGQRQSDFEMEVSGTIANSEVEIFSDSIYADLTGGQVAIAVENAQLVEFDLGYGVSVFARAQRDKRYSGSATMEPTDRDIRIFDDYSDIESVYHLSTNGFTDSAQVKLDTPDDVYYVYSGDLEYLGKTSDMLAYSGTYYISSVELDVDTDEPLPDTEPQPELEDLGGGGSNIPDTGVGMMLPTAIAAGAIALVIIVLLARKKKS